MSDEAKNIVESSCDFIKKSFELKNLKLYKEAIEMLYKALNCNDISQNNAEITSQIGDLYFLLKNYERALEQYEKVLETDKIHKHTLFQICKIYFIQKKYKEALNLIEELCRNSVETASFVQYFKIMYELKMSDKMAEVYEGLNDEIKNNEEILYIMSLMSSDKKQEYLQKTVEANPKNVDAKFDLGVVYYNKGELEYAREQFEFVIQNQKNAKAYNYLGLIHQAKGEFQKAIENFYNASRIDKIQGIYFFNLAKAYIDIHWLDEAQTAIQKSLRLMQLKNGEDFDLGEHYYILAWINWYKKNYKNALLNLDLIDKSSSSAPDALILRYTIDFDLGDIVSSKIRLENIYESEQNVKNPNLLSALGKIYKDLKMYDKAIKIYREALLIYPDSYEFLTGIAEACIDSKDYENASKYTLKLREKYPASTDGYNCCARIFYRKKEYEKALEELTHLVKLDQNNAEAFYFMGLISNDLNVPPKAREYLRIALNLNPLEPKYYAQMARSYELENSFEDALLFIKEAIDIAPSDIGYIKTAKNYCLKRNDAKGADFYENHMVRLEKILRSGKEE